MRIDSNPGRTFTTFVTGAPTGRVDEIGYKVQPAGGGVDLIARTVAGIVEGPVGVYTAEDVLVPPLAELGTYFVVWDDPDLGLVSEEHDMLVLSVLGWAPEIQDVADLLMARTRTRGGALAREFNENTDPTGVDVAGLIAKATNDVAGVLGDSVPEAFADKAKNLATIRAAMYLELGWYPEQITTNRSPYREFKDLYEKGLLKLEEEIEQAAGTDGVEAGITAGMPSYAFPPSSIGDGIMP